MHPMRIFFGPAARRLALSALLAPGALPARAELQLYMFEQVGCIYCEQWKREVGDAYPLTAEGRAAPLVPVNIRADLPAGLSVVSPPHFTPTFVLAQDGVELGRIEGYPGEAFFWGLLGQMIAAAPGATVTD
ncbi:thioredoxin family protein [Paracoccaceae bacterium Fryx2]|nr:thioredoxin family protein [Paracoccaceae bacterium Fryx2]